MKRSSRSTIWAALPLLPACAAIWGIEDTSITEDASSGGQQSSSFGGSTTGTAFGGAGGLASAGGSLDAMAGTAGADAGRGGAGEQWSTGGAGGDVQTTGAADDGGAEEPTAGVASAGASGGTAAEGGAGGSSGGTMSAGGTSDGTGVAGGNVSGGAQSTPEGGQGGTSEGFGVLPPIEQRPFLAQHPWPLTFIDVCYRSDMGLTAAATFAARVQQLFGQTWGREVDVDLLSWQPCENVDSTIVVTLSTAESSSADLGFGTAAPRRMTLNAAASDPEILHYLGRLLGFENEYAFDELPGPCVPCVDASDCTMADGLACLNGFCGVPAVHESIMAAPGCSGIEPTRRLTPWDIMAAQRAYARKPIGSIVTSLGECLDIYAADATDGTPLIHYPCIRTENQMWSFDFAATVGESDWLSATAQGQKRCGAADGNGGAVSTLCSRDEALQNATLNGGLWRGIGGLCVAATHASIGAPLQMEECGTTPELERWTVRAGEFQLSGTEYCATASSAVGSNITLAPCGSSSGSQQFILSRGVIETPWGCMNVAGGLPAAGSALILWDACRFDLENEVFYWSGPIRMGAACLDASNFYIGAAPCVESPTQEWDYYF